MNTTQKGFTLIELVMVIVILGILAATAIPKFIDLSGEARDASVKGLAGSISSAFAINYAAVSAGNANGTNLGTDTELCDATTINGLLSTPIDFTNDYQISAGSLDCQAGNSGDSATCTLQDQNDATATADFSALCAK